MILTKKAENIIVAMTNTLGGIIAYGVKDNKSPFPLSSKERDDIQNQITNICRNNVDPPISPEFKSIILENDLGYIIVYIPQRNKILHSTSDGRTLKRIGSNNVIMKQSEMSEFYKGAK